MFRITLKNLSARKLRLFTTSIAVLLGVAFMAGTLVLTATIGQAFDTLFADANHGTDAYVRGDLAFDDEVLGEQRTRIDTATLDAIRNLDGVAAADGYIEAYAQLVDHDGEPLGDPAMGAPVIGSAWIADDELNTFDLTDGRGPESDHEVVIDRGSAKRGEFTVDDTVQVLTQHGPLDVTIVGIATFAGSDSPGGASFTMFTPAAAQANLTEPGKVDAIKVRAADGVSPTELVDRIETIVPDRTEVLTGAEITAEQQAALKSDMAFLNVFLLVFAMIALFVGSFIIYNSFSILVAQRTKEMAMMRAIGAGRRQVLGSVLTEAVTVGLIASAFGLAAGVGVAAGLKALMTGLGIDFPAGSVVVTTSTVIISLVAGLGVSVVSAVLPARRAAKVAPIAALRDGAIDSSASSHKRAITGFGVTGLGALLMAAGLFGGAGIAPVGLGAVVVFLGIAALGPILARPVSRIIGAPLPRLKGMAGTLARENAMRNPKRTSATAAALMIGVALVGAITILASSTKASLSDSVEDNFNGDFVIDSGANGSGGFSADAAARLAELPELAAVSSHRVAAAEVDGHGAQLNAVDPVSIQAIVDADVVSGSLDDLTSTSIAVTDDLAEQRAWSVGDTLPVRFADTGEQQFTLSATFDNDDSLGQMVISLAAYDANVADSFDTEIFALAAEGVDRDAAREAVVATMADYPQADVLDKDDYAAAQTKQMDTILNLIYALLGLAVFIALLGIANTLALSIFERTRELGLLRAVGMTRHQLRATVRYEAVIIALFGTMLGLAIGTGFGWAIVTALSAEGLDTFRLPVNSLAILTLVGALAGVVAAVLPAHRAARRDILDAIASD